MIAAAVKQGAEKIGETGQKFAILGTQEGIVVDDAARIKGCMWVHVPGQEPFLAIDDSGELTYDNSAGGLNVEVELCYPPNRSEGKDTPHISRLTQRGRANLGGINPLQMGLVRAQSPQAERLTTLRLTKGSSGLAVGMTGGWYMRGGYLDYAQPNDNIADLSSYVPSTTGFKKYVVVCWDGNQAVIEDRGEFDPASFIAPDQIKGAITPGCIRLGYALLEEGVTEWPDNDHVLPLPHLYNAAGETFTAAAPTASDDSDAGYAKGWLWINTSAQDVYIATDVTPGAATWKLLTAGGSGGNVFSSLYVQGDSFQHSFQNNTILFTDYSDLQPGVTHTYGKARGSLDTPADVQTGDYIAEINYWAWAVDAWRAAVKERFEVLDASPSNTSMAGKWSLFLSDSGSVTPGLALDATAKRINFSVPLALPNMTTTQRDALTPAAGWKIYNTTTSKAQTYNGSTWVDEGGSSGIDVEENGSSVVATSTILDFKDFNVEDDTGGQAGIYHNINSIFQARLTLTSGSPYAFNSDVTSTTVYLTPLDSGDQIALYDGTRVKLFTHTEKSFPLTNVLSCTTTNASTTVTTADTSQLVAGMKVTGTGIPANTTISSITNSTTLVLSANATTSATNNLTFVMVKGWVLDIYVFPNGGTTPKMIAVKWSDATTKPSRPTNNGFVTKNGDATARFVGSIMVDPDTDGQTCLIRGALAQDDKIKPKWLVSNAYNTIECKFAYDVEDAHSYNSVTTRAYDGNSTDNRGYVCLYSDKIIKLRLEVQAADIAFGSDYAYIGLGVDVTNASTYNFVVSAIASLRVSSTQFGILTAGGHTLYLVEAAVNAVTFQNCRFEILTEF